MAMEEEKVEAVTEGESSPPSPKLRKLNRRFGGNGPIFVQEKIQFLTHFFYRCDMLQSLIYCIMYTYPPTVLHGKKKQFCVCNFFSKFSMPSGFVKNKKSSASSRTLKNRGRYPLFGHWTCSQKVPNLFLRISLNIKLIKIFF